MKITRRLVGALMATAITFGAVGMTATPAHAMRDTGWPIIGTR
jgi:hypothetical protein